MLLHLQMAITTMLLTRTPYKKQPRGAELNLNPFTMQPNEKLSSSFARTRLFYRIVLFLYDCLARITVLDFTGV